MTLRDELTAMMEKARRYMGSAEVLRVHKDYDSAVSRLYYAIFYCAEAMLMARGLSFSSHKAVISAFARQFVKPGLVPKEFHKWLQAAFTKRQVSDYEFIATVDEADVAGLQRNAEQFLARTDEFLKTEGYL